MIRHLRAILAERDAVGFRAGLSAATGCSVTRIDFLPGAELRRLMPPAAGVSTTPEHLRVTL